MGDKLYLAPLSEDIQVRSYTNNTTPPMLMYEDIKTAVDIGTGTGIWAM